MLVTNGPMSERLCVDQQDCPVTNDRIHVNKIASYKFYLSDIMVYEIGGLSETCR
jgi:hypothetical protein